MSSVFELCAVAIVDAQHVKLNIQKLLLLK